MLVCFLPLKNRKTFAHDVKYAYATLADLVHDVTEKQTDRHKMAGFATLLSRLSNISCCCFFKQTVKIDRKTAVSLFLIPFLSIGPVMFLCSVSPLRA